MPKPSDDVLFIGHSLVGPNIPAMLADVIDTRGGGSVARQVINGAPLVWNWNNSARAEGVDARAVLPRGDIEALVITEAVPLLNHTTWSNSSQYALNFYNLAMDSNPGARVYLYETWHSLRSGTGVDVEYDDNDDIPWRKRLDENLSDWEGIVDSVNDRNDAGDPDMLIVPAGQAMARMSDEIAAGRAPGLTRIQQLFEDDIHTNDLGNYFVTMVQYATLYGQSPVGLPATLQNQWGGDFQAPSPALAAKMQAVAWEVVTGYDRSGVAGGALPPPPPPANRAPDAAADAASTAAGRAVVIDALANDTDPDGNPLSISALGRAAHGTVALEAGRIRYTPEAGFAGQDAFTYTVSDGKGGADTATISVAVEAPKPPPPPAPGPYAGFAAEYFTLASGVSKLSDVNFAAKPAATGLLVGLTRLTNDLPFWKGGPADNFAARFTTTLTVEKAGTYTFYLTSDDGSALMLDGARVIDNDGLHATTEKRVTRELGAGAHTLEVRYFEQGGDQTLRLAWNGPDTGGVRKAVAGKALSAAPAPANKAPDAVADAASTTADTSVLIDALANDADPDGNPLAISALGRATHGTVALEAGRIRYTPEAGFAGADAFTYTVSDGKGGADTASIAVTVTPPKPVPAPGGFAAEYFVLARGVSSLTEVNFAAAPTATGTLAALNRAGSDAPFWTGGPADNFAARMTATLTIEKAGRYTFYLVSDDGSTLTLDGARVINNDGLHAATEARVARDLAAGTHTLEVRYFESGGDQTLRLDWAGPDTGGGRKALSGKALGTVPTTPPANAAPDAVADAASTAADTAVLIDALANDTDPDGNPLAISGLGRAGHGTVALEAGRIRYIPEAGFAGADAFTYTVSDGKGGADTGRVTVTVTVKAPPPVAGPAEGLANPSLAMGLSGLADWSSQQPFIDVMKVGRAWTGHLPGQWGGWSASDLAARGYLDADGWPTKMPGALSGIATLVLTDIPANAASLAGRYKLSYDGMGTIDVSGSVSNVTKRSGEIWFDYKPGTAIVTITATDPRGTGDYVRDISIVKAENVALHEAGAIFNPDWLARIEDLRAVRFMDWMATNDSELAAWADRPQAGDYTYALNGAPVEVMVALANEIGADPWFNMPHKASDAYMREFAQYVRDNLDPKLKAHVEYSNEVWNWQFGQAQWADAQAKARWGADAPGDAWVQYAGMRAAQMAQIWDGVFGAQADARLVKVIGTQTGWLGLEKGLLEAPLWTAENPGQNRAPAEYFDAYAVTGYFGSDGSDAEALRIKQWIAESLGAANSAANAQGLTGAARTAYVAEHKYDQASVRTADYLEKGAVADLLGEILPYQARVAEAHGLDLIMYEGGTHLVGIGKWTEDAELTAFLTHFNYTPAVARIYETVMAGWKDAGGTLFNAFVDVATPSKWGSWGALRTLEDDNPRGRALEAFNRDVAAWWENRDADTFDHGVTRIGTEGADTLAGTAEEDILVGLGGDDLLTGRGGADRLHGGAGSDVALLTGKRADYDFESDGATLLAKGADGTTTRLLEIETLRFVGEPGLSHAAADF